MTLKEILIAGKLTVSEGGGGGGDDTILNQVVDKSYSGVLTLATAASIGKGALRGMDYLKEVIAPLATSVEENGMYYCADLEHFHGPEVTSIGLQAFSRVGTNSGLNNTVIVLPKLATMSGRAHFDRGNFKAIDLGPNLSALTPDCFYNNTGAQTVKALVLRKSDAVVTTPSTDTINGLRDVYVPSSLISSYEAAAKWAERVTGGYITFHAIEGSIYENAYADGTPIA